MIFEAFISWLSKVLHWDSAPIHPDPVDVYFSYKTNPMTQKVTEMPTQPVTPAQSLYIMSKSLLGQHLTLNENVPWMVGCMEAVSLILFKLGIPGIPDTGIEGTAAGLDFLARSASFTEVEEYAIGAILIAATGTGNGKIRGHVGVCGEFQIMSNNSETGKWDTQWTIDRWLAYYGDYGGIKTRYFFPV